MSPRPVLLECPRLVLRELTEADWRAIHVYAREPEVVEFMAWGPNTEEESKDFVRRAIAAQRVDPRRSFELGIVLRESGELIGDVGIRAVDEAGTEGHIGYVLHPAHWGKGLATEAARAIVTFGFQGLGFHRVRTHCDVRNVASARVLEKIGMRREGLMRQNTLIRGAWQDSYLYAMLETDDLPGTM